VNGKRVHSIRDLQSYMKGADKTVALLIQRRETQLFVPVQVR
jgi:S1-C subfamily serine protease